jgi:hypothetical protein
LQNLGQVTRAIVPCLSGMEILFESLQASHIVGAGSHSTPAHGGQPRTRLADSL